MKFKNILLLYKRSAYKIYFQDKKNSFKNLDRKFLKNEMAHFERSHDEHYDALHQIQRILYTLGAPFTDCYRGNKIDYSKFDLVITVGGDGTFLEAARHIVHQPIIGVNSAPDYSVGRFCAATVTNFEKIVRKVLDGSAQYGQLQRLQLEVKDIKLKVNVLNDVLISHQNPAMLCRYYLTLNSCKEEQRSSGVWVATAVGSTGAIHSSGGKVLDQFDKRYQYMPRELYAGRGTQYKLKGGICSRNQILNIVSLMRNGMLYVDGAHHKYSFPFGAHLKLSNSPNSLKTVIIQ